MIALDLFAGTGWGVACKRLGIEEYGVEIAPASVATRAANGMETIYHDVWEGLEGRHDVPDYDTLIASPPCQTFSMAGSGAGRKALDEVLGLVDSKAYRDVAELRAFGERHDPRTSLVLTPLAHVYRDAPTYVVMEQVPTVLPVWERVAEEMRAWGYSVVTGNLQAEMYGVPQTRKRAILIARADGVEARMPTPTHSRYYPRDRKRLDPGVKPWASMVEALGWGMTERPYPTIAGGAKGDAHHPSAHQGGQDPSMVGGSAARRTIAEEESAGRWLTANDRLANSATRHESEPAMTITGGHDSGNRVWRTPSGAIKLIVEEAAALQSYPEGFVFEGNKGAQFLHVGNAVPPLLAEAILATLLPERIEP